MAVLVKQSFTDIFKKYLLSEHRDVLIDSIQFSEKKTLLDQKMFDFTVFMVKEVSVW